MNLNAQAGPELNARSARVDGYRGIWFTLGQFSTWGDKYSGGLATYTSSHIPIAVYSKRVNKTFFVYGGTTSADERKLLIMISFYDHAKHRVPRPVIVYEKTGVNDPHDNASISFDDKGYIWVFVSGRNTTRPGIIFKSRKPFEIEQFEKVSVGEITYPQPWFIEGKGFLHLFTRYTRGRELYWSTSADGKDWTIANKLAGFGGHYQISNRQGNKIVSAFNYHPGGNVDKRTNLYLLQTLDMGKTWTSVDGQPVTTPVTSKENPALVKDYQASNELVYLNDIGFDSSGNPVILTVISNDFKPGPPGNNRKWIVFRWTGKVWTSSQVCSSTHNYDMGSLYINGSHWIVIGPTETGPQALGTGGEIAKWESDDNGLSWKKTNQLTVKSSRNHGYVRRPSVMHPDFVAFWADGDADKLSISKLYFADDRGQVYELPYEMKSAYAVPRRIKSLGAVKNR